MYPRVVAWSKGSRDDPQPKDDEMDHETDEVFKPEDAYDCGELLIEALQEKFPTHAVRRVGFDEIAVEDDNGDDWQIIVKGPGA
jgi:hypothetical protein